MPIDYLLQGLLIGFSVAAPVGPIGVLCIKRTLNEGRISGFITGLGAAVADSVYGCIAGFGITVVSSFLEQQMLWFKLLGGIVLLYMGVTFLRSKPASQEATVQGGGLIKNFASTLLLTLTNPSTIFSFVAIFAGMGLGMSEANRSVSTSIAVVAGVFVGSALWWLILSSVVGFMQNKLTARHLIWVNRLSGMIILCFGIWAIISGISLTLAAG